MATVDELVVAIRADMRDIERKLDGLERNSTRTARTMQQRFESAARGINSAFRAIRGPALAATATGTAFAYMARRSLEAVESIQDLADRANVSAEFLQEMRFAINQSGGSARDFDDAISRLNRRFGLFLNNLRTGTGEAGPAAAAFRALGLESRIASGELDNAEAVFRAAVEQIQNVESAAQRAALASQLFGEDSGPRLVALLDRGVTGIDELARAARDAGVVLENELVANASAASDAIEVMEQQVGAQFNRAIAENSEGLVNFAQLLTNIATAAIRAAAAIGNLFSNTSPERASAFQAMADTLVSANAQGEPLTRDQIQYWVRFQSRMRGEDGLEFMREVNRIFEERSYLDQPGVLDPLGVRDLTALLLEMASAERSAAREAEELEASINALSADGPTETAGGLTRVSESAEEAADNTGQLRENLESVADFAKEGAPELVDALDLLKVQIDGLADGAVKNLEDAFVEFVQTGRLEIQSFVNYIIEQFARIAFQETIGNGLTSMFRSAFNFVLGGSNPLAAAVAGGMTGGSSIGGASGSAVSGVISGISLGAGQISMGGGMQAAGAQVSQSFTIDARGAEVGVEERIRQVLQAEGPRMQQQTMRATIEAIGRINRSARTAN